MGKEGERERERERENLMLKGPRRVLRNSISGFLLIEMRTSFTPGHFNRLYRNKSDRGTRSKDEDEDALISTRSFSLADSRGGKESGGGEKALPED